MKPDLTLENAWSSFEDKVIDTEAPQIQKDEMRLAFFAGALAMKQRIKQIAVIQTNPMGATLMLLWHAELEQEGRKQMQRLKNKEMVTH